MQQKNALQSMTIWGFLVLVFNLLNSKFGWGLGDETIQDLTNVIGVGMMLIGRWRKGDLTLGGPTPAAILALPLLLVGCTTTNYNIDFHEGAFRVADEMKVTPGQGGDDSSSTAGAPTTGGNEASPGGSNLLRGFAQQGNIFQIGTAAKPVVTTDAKATATVQSPNSQTGAGDEVSNAQPAPPPTE